MVMRKTLFQKISTSIQLILVFLQFVLFFVSDLAGISLRNANLAWYRFFARYLSFEYMLFIGLQDILVIEPDHDDHHMIIHFIPSSLENANFIPKCHYAGRNALILTSFAVVLSLILMIMISQRMAKSEDSNRLRATSFIISIMTFALGLSAYLHFYDGCITEVRDYLNDNGYYDVYGMATSRGGSMVGAIVCNILVILLLIIEILQACLRYDGRAQREDNRVKDQEMIVPVATPV